MTFSIAAFRERVGRASRGERELWLLASAVAFGVILLPALIYVAGNTTLGVYEGGGFGAFLADFFKGLFRPHIAYWLVVLGPYLIISLARCLWATRKWLRNHLSARIAVSAPPTHPGRRN